MLDHPRQQILLVLDADDRRGDIRIENWLIEWIDFGAASSHVIRGASGAPRNGIAVA
jgi:hypothetical protein